MGSGGGFDGRNLQQDRSGERAMNLALAKAQKEQANAEASASMAQAKARSQEEMAKEKAQKEAIQASEAAAAVEVDATQVAGQADIADITDDRPAMQGMNFLQIPEEEEEVNTDTRGG
tara:strand:- start:7 stop:360 length:354 start_codon:yes stop_codon:yes gene_type:complete